MNQRSTPREEGAGACDESCTCGAPQRERILTLGVGPTTRGRPARTASGRHDLEQALIPAGTFTMGDSSGDRNPGDGEVPQHPVTLEAFSIDATAVTNDAFARFVDATAYRTEAEIFGYSAVFHLALQAPEEDVINVPAGTPWWLAVQGADWKHPGGRDSTLEGLGDHPVVHVSWNDAVAYCEWSGRRLPTEAEWEYAARGGIEQAKYPWGDDAVDAGGWRANIWQGVFPYTNTRADGFPTTAPVRSFDVNGYGLWQPVGNVWEWCQDWFDPRYYETSPVEAPPGPASGNTRVLRGGSYLCHLSYCNRYRNSARSQNTADSSMGNAGFRTVAA